jgi:hypothetical protein
VLELTAGIDEGTTRPATSIGSVLAVTAELAVPAVCVRVTAESLGRIVAVESAAVVGEAAGAVCAASSGAFDAVAVGGTGRETVRRRVESA